MSKFATDPTPPHFKGEDVIGDDLYSHQNRPVVNPIPQQLAAKLNQVYNTNLDNYGYESEEINIPHSVQINYQKEQPQSEVITKNIKINLEINLKINVL